MAGPVRFRKRALAHRCGVAAVAVVCAGALSAEPLAVIETGPDVAMPDGAMVLDIRDEDTCIASAPPNARCLPAALLLYSDAGAPLGFHALRWVLGALGLSGAEPMVIYGGAEVARDDVLAAAALLYLTGQAEVLVHQGAAMETGDRGAPRGLWREKIYTAPMRTNAMAVAVDPKGAMRDRLKDFAEGGGAVAFGGTS